VIGAHLTFVAGNNRNRIATSSFYQSSGTSLNDIGFSFGPSGRLVFLPPLTTAGRLRECLSALQSRAHAVEDDSMFAVSQWVHRDQKSRDNRLVNQPNRQVPSRCCTWTPTIISQSNSRRCTLVLLYFWTSSPRNMSSYPRLRRPFFDHGHAYRRAALPSFRCRDEIMR
jgi:hypothetical protein